MPHAFHRMGTDNGCTAYTTFAGFGEPVLAVMLTTAKGGHESCLKAGQWVCPLVGVSDLGNILSIQL